MLPVLLTWMYLKVGISLITSSERKTRAYLFFYWSILLEKQARQKEILVTDTKIVKAERVELVS